MKLLRLILQGFKSFADKTTIEFADGMTVIVGPNGCGKSNISDAVRWVLGEQNIRNLRGQKSEDIIFSGAEGRQARNAAEVTLVLDNSSHELPLDTVEVAITRRILRSGDSEFQLNKRSCRLKDIQELLTQTGLGKGSMAIIGQNRVDQVLTAHPDERRLIFEEVAGIGLYRMRKNEGLRKLERTAENMERVRDLVALLDEQLEPLKEAAEKSKVYKSLSKEKSAVAVTMTLLRLASIGRMLSRYESEYHTLMDEKVSWEAKLAKFSVEKEELEAKALSHQEALREAAGRLSEKQNFVERLRGDYRVKEEALHHAEEETKRLDEDFEDQCEAEKELSEEIETISLELQEAEKLLKEEQQLVLTEEKKKEELSKQLAIAEGKYREKQKAYQAQMAEKERLTGNIELNEKEIQRLTAVKEGLVAEEMKAMAACKELKLQKQVYDKKEVELKKSLKETEEAGDVGSQELKKAEDERYHLLQVWNEKQAEGVQLKSRREYLERSEREYANFSRTTKTILENRSLWGDHVIGPVGELLHVPAKYTVAAEVALGAAVSYIVTDTAKSAGEMIQWLKENHAGRVTFYPLDTMKMRGSDEIEKEACAEKGVCGIAADLFLYDEEYTSLMSAILGKIVIVEDLKAAQKVSAKYKHRIRLVTLDGQLVHPGGSLTGGSMKKKENLYFGRKEEINEILRQEDVLARELKALGEKRRSHDDICAALSDKVTELRSLCQNQKMEYAALSGQKEGLIGALASQEQLAEKLKTDCEETEQSMTTTSERLAEWRTALQDYANIPDMEDDEESKQIKVSVKENENALLTLRINATKAEEKVNFCRRGKEERLQAQKEQAKDRKEIECAIEENKNKKIQLTQELENIQKQFEIVDNERKEMEKAQENLQNASESFIVHRKNSDMAWREAAEKSSAIQKDMADRKARIENFTLQEQEELDKLKAVHLTRERAEAFRLPGSMADMKEKETELDERIAALGTVNPNGEEEYEVQVRRRAFYETQIEDLKKAKSGLETIIHDIDVTMTKQFSDAFQMINVEFARIMKLMFSGGDARLELTDTAHPLEGGVDMYLQLPGKKRQPLTLMSGGERALTVIALLMSFMAYRPAPFCFVDEIDAALDDANVERYSRMIGDYKKKTQFVIISHRKKTMEFADTLQGVTMAEKGVSSLITVRVGDYIKG